MNNPKISVIIPVYNPGQHLIKCLNSILGQTYQNLQVILIDDGSSDGSGEICDQYASRDTRVICLHQQNAGVSSARNKGLEYATGDYYNFPDSDDYLEPDTYEYLLNLIDKHKCDAVNFEYYVTYPERERTHLLSDEHYGLFEVEDAHRLIMTSEPFAWNKLFSKKLITANNHLPGIKFREDIYRGEDTLFAQEATDRADKVWFDKKPLYHYVQSEESAVRGKFRKTQLSALKLYDAYRCLWWEKYPELKPLFLKGMSHLLISLYYGMWNDDEPYIEERRKVVDRFRLYKKDTFQGAITAKERFKFDFFSLSPELFCQFHKRLHRL